MGGTAAAGISAAGVVGSGVGTMAGVLGFLGSLSGETGVDNISSYLKLETFPLLYTVFPALQPQPIVTELANADPWTSYEQRLANRITECENIMTHLDQARTLNYLSGS